MLRVTEKFKLPITNVIKAGIHFESCYIFRLGSLSGMLDKVPQPFDSIIVTQMTILLNYAVSTTAQPTKREEE
jgi:hypothetical protein